ncbi:universal stress protein [Pedobacter nyackensis]|uniref:Nucleotide-binding universal stress protein, UspA family n=1 Tax=Pedobacter nyackensis TaxID=475255 RepID=A0A1W2DBJ5_9SPHI|nr:universal stress protein [Pedobacter nyackensis]SMC94644.1 Nucleotide-binding universal stress protein, UspA family [Pedobacter nyackensis]
METFSVKFSAGSIELNAMVTAYDHNRQFKVEMVTNEPSPILLMRSSKGLWSVIQRGERNITDKEFIVLQEAIEAQMCQFYGVESMLVLTDFSEEALNACKYAVALSAQLNTTRLTLYHSYEPIMIPPTAFAPVTEGFVETPDESLEKITKIKNELEPLAPAHTKIDVRTDERSLLAAVNMLVQQLHSGLVVTGITGKSKLERVLIGSNTLNLARECLAPLLIVPPQAVYKKIETVVFACDLRQVLETTPVFAIKTFIDVLGAKLLILNVDRSGAYFDTNTILEMSDLHLLWDDERPEYHYTDHEDTAIGIMEFSNEHHADLVITVPKIYGFFESIFHRSLTKKLAYHSHLPLLLFREEL